MRSVEGTFKNGIAYPNELIKEQDGESVIITFMDSNLNHSPSDDLLWNSDDLDQFDQLIENCLIDTDIEDLAYQHDHYIHGTPKRAS